MSRMVAVTFVAAALLMCLLPQADALSCYTEPYSSVPTNKTTVLGWGVNSNYQLGAQRDGADIVRRPALLFTSPNPNQTVTRIVSSVAHSLALDSHGGRAYGVGDGREGTLASGPQSVAEIKNFNAISQVLHNDKPKLLEKNKKTLDVAAGWHHTCILIQSLFDDRQDVYCSGRNDVGQLGSSTIKTQISYPVILNLSALEWPSIKSIAVGSDHNAVLTTDGTVLTWGAGAHGELGNGQTPKYSTSVSQLPIRSAVVDVQCGHRFCLALTALEELYGWGLNDANQLGLGDGAQNKIVTRPVSIAKGVSSFAAGGSHVMAVIDGVLHSWGQGTMGQTGQKKTIAGELFTDWSVGTPTPIPFFEDVAVQSIAAGLKHSVVLDTCGHVYTFGSNAFGQLGVGRLSASMQLRSYDPLEVTTIAARKLKGLKVYAGAFTSFYVGQPPDQ